MQVTVKMYVGRTLFSFYGAKTQLGPRAPHCFLHHTQLDTHTGVRPSGRGIGPSQRPLHDNKQHSLPSQQANGRKPKP